MISKACFYRYILLFVIGIISQTTVGQESYNKQIRIQHDNDFPFGIDRLYTAGSFGTYSHILAGDFLFKRDSINPIQLDFTFGQETYTPRELFERDFDLFERPYAGYLFVSGKTTQVRRNHLWSLQGEIGVTGSISLAETLQVAYHELINEFIPVWEGQIANGLHINARGTYIKDVEIKKPGRFTFFSLKSTLALGTRSIFAKQEALLFLGNRASLGQSSAFNRIGTVKEFYGFVGVGGTYVVHNAVIEGHLFGDNSPFTLDPVSFLFNFQSGITYRKNRNTFQLIYNFQSPETRREGRLQYASFVIARKF